MGRFMDELKYRTGHCSFEWAEEYEARKREARPVSQYGVQIRHSMLNINTVVNAQSPSDAVDIILKDGVKVNPKQWSIQLIPYKEENLFHTNVKVTKLSGMKRVSYYELIIMPTAQYEEYMRIEQQKADWARREQYQGIY